MGTCCGVVIVCLILSLVLYIWAETSSAIAARNAAINDAIQGFHKIWDSLKSQENSVTYTVKDFFSKSEGTTYERVLGTLASTLDEMMVTVENMKSANKRIVNLSSKDDMSGTITEAESQAISYLISVTDGLKLFGQKVYTLPLSRMMNEKKYGKYNKSYWESVNELKRDSVVEYINNCERLLSSTDFDHLFKIDIEEVLKCVWFFATEKVFSASDFQKAENVFARIYKFQHVDLIISDLYAKKKVGGEDALRDSVYELLKKTHDSQKLTLIASGLMWMNAYQSENLVLQHMLTTGKEMSVKTQERLHSLVNGGGKAPSGFDVKPSDDALYFDISALAWKDEEYTGLFENLAFSDKTLTYSLAIRDENKDLFISQNIKVPNTKEILDKFKTVFAEEYGSVVGVQSVNCIALSGNGKEQIEGILVSTKECKQMGIVIHIARIGKKLIIKFYTLFMPTVSDLIAQKQQALSIYKKLSPSVTMWESSLKDTMLMAVEQLLNAGENKEIDERESRPVDNEPVF